MLRIDGAKTLQDVAPLALCGCASGVHHHIASRNNRLLVCNGHRHTRFKGGDGCGKTDNASRSDQRNIRRGIKNERTKVVSAATNEAACLRMSRSESIMLLTTAT
jgi:hypothetical protein